MHQAQSIQLCVQSHPKIDYLLASAHESKAKASDWPGSIEAHAELVGDQQIRKPPNTNDLMSRWLKSPLTCLS